MSALSIRTRLTLWYSGLLLVILVAIGALSYSWLRRTVHQDLDASLLAVALAIRDTGAPDRPESEVEAVLREMLGPELYDKFFRLLDPEGRPYPFGSRPRGGAEPVLRLADLSMDPATRVVTRGRRRIALTAREYALLEYFLRNPGRVLTRPMITQHVWGMDFDPESNIVDVYVGYLRRKIDADGEPRLLQTVRGAGYSLSAEL